MASLQFGRFDLPQDREQYRTSLLLNNGYAATVSVAAVSEKAEATLTLYTPDRSGLLKPDEALMQEIRQAAAPCDDITGLSPAGVEAILKNLAARPQHPNWNLAAADKNFARKAWKEIDPSRWSDEITTTIIFPSGREVCGRVTTDTSIPRSEWDFEAPLATPTNPTARAVAIETAHPFTKDLMGLVTGQDPQKPSAEIYLEASRQLLEGDTFIPSLPGQQGSALDELYQQTVSNLLPIVAENPSFAALQMQTILTWEIENGRDAQTDALFRAAVHAAPQAIRDSQIRDWTRDIVMKDEIELPEPRRERLIHMLAVIMPERLDMMPELRDHFKTIGRRFTQNIEARGLAKLAQETAPQAKGRLSRLISWVASRTAPKNTNEHP